MNTPPEAEPLWREEVSFLKEHERYVSRRQLTKFLTLTSLGMWVGNLWILARASMTKQTAYPIKRICTLDELPVGETLQFAYPSENDACLLICTAPRTFVAYSQKCTHLSCAVYYVARTGHLECPCHEGHFSAATGRVLQGPPPRPLPRIVLQTDGQFIYATGVDLQKES